MKRTSQLFVFLAALAALNVSAKTATEYIKDHEDRIIRAENAIDN